MEKVFGFGGFLLEGVEISNFLICGRFIFGP